ncbi:MAG: MerR family transcriptional regulator [Oscillospiraceae bacterium]|nr:MerR family transcriptional regulator [Oscillospiraceae bacterium]
MKKYLTVKEFSRLSGIEQTTLRYWDEIGLFSPVRRDPENHYRYYSPEQIIAVNFITVLSGLNVPLKTISAMSGERTPENILRLIEQQEKLLDMEMSRLRESYSIIHTRVEMIRYALKLKDGYMALDGVRLDSHTTAEGAIHVDESKISVLKRDEKAFILGPPNVFYEGELFYQPFMRFCRQSEELRINLHYPIGGYHNGMEDFLSAPGKPNMFFSFDPTGNRRRPAGDYLVGFHRGDYGDLGDLPDRMEAYAEDNALTVSGPVYTLYLLDETCVKDPGQYLAQVIVAVRR